MLPDDRVMSFVVALQDLDAARPGPLVQVPAGEWLFHQGDAPTGAYVVESGRLEIVDEAGGGRVLRVVSRGTVVGELAMLSGELRPEGIRAVRDTTLRVLPRDAFERLAEVRPGFGMSLARGLAHALREMSTGAPEASGPPVTIGVLALGNASAEAITAELVQRLRGLGAARVFGAGDADPEQWGAALDAAERSFNHVLLPAGPDAPAPWREFCLRQADRTLVLVGGEPPPDPDPRLRGCHLLLDPELPTEAWIEALEPARTHRSDDLDRLARALAGRAVGVVLSGGGARGLAHIGVLAELEAAGVVVDRIGGCSMGSLIAALYALGRTPDEMAAACRAELVKRRPFGDYTVPRTSLIRAHRARAMLDRLFGEERIECLSRSFFCVSADLLTADVVVHRDGLLRDAVLSSMSVPGVMPPRRVGGRLLVDGGVLDNLPLGPMIEGGEGPVVAVDAMGRRLTAEDERADAQPGILEILARASVLGSWRQGRAQAELATVAVRPAIADVGMLDFGRLEEVIDAGRQAASAALADGGLAALAAAPAATERA